MINISKVVADWPVNADGCAIDSDCTVDSCGTASRGRWYRDIL